jgi:hypothetical protein
MAFWITTGSGRAGPAGRFTDPSGPDASRDRLRLLLQRCTTQKQRKGAGLAAVR